MKSKLMFFIPALLILGCKKNNVELCVDTGSLSAGSGFFLGTAVDVGMLKTEARYEEIVHRQFNSITPENVFKANHLHPQENSFYWKEADYLVGYAEENNKRIHGHTLIWHKQLPPWILNFQGSPSEWDNLFKNHLQTIIYHFKGKVKSWDVVNEALNEDGTLRNNIWMQRLGPGYIEKAFRYAHEADPNALLFYNDFSLEHNPKKRKAALKLLNNLRARGLIIHGIGLQMHIGIDYPENSQIAEAFNEVSSNGYLLHLSEIDISVNPLNRKVSNKQLLFKRQAEKLAALILFYKELPEEHQFGITFWGVSDRNTWIRSYFNREDYPLLYDDNYHPKLAYCKLKDVL